MHPNFKSATPINTPSANANASIRVKIHDLLNAELAKPEVNLRSVEKLSLAFSRHIIGEREATNIEILDVNRADARLTNAGFEIAKFPDDYDN